jgi:hypothetical protein
MQCRTLKHVAQYSPLLPEHVKSDIARSSPQQSIKERFQREHLLLSELPQFLNKTHKLDVPVFTVWGACEDVSVLEKLRSGEYKIDNLHVIDESHSRLLDVGGVKLRLLGLGGAVVMHKMFDNGEGRTTIAGGQGTMWTTILQIGELIDTANRVYDPTETRVLVTHASPAREGLLNQLSVTLKADFSISAGLHFRYGSSYNEFSVNPSLDHYRGKLSASKAQFNDVWETVKHEVEPAVAENEAQNKLLQMALELVNKMPSTASGGNPFGGGPPNGQVDESAFKNMWNFNLADAAFGWLVLDIDQGRIGTEMRAQGFNFSHRGGKAQRPQGVPSAPSNSTVPPTGGNLPTPGQQAQQQPRFSQGPPQQTGQQPMAQRQMQEMAQPKPVQQQNPAGPPAQKPATPAAQANAPLTANGTTGPTATIPGKDTPQNNGTASETPRPTEMPKQNFPPPEPSKGIFINNVPDEIDTPEQVKAELFSPEDAAKIERMEKQGSQGRRYVAHFKDNETMRAVLKNGMPKEARDKYAKPGGPQVRMAEYRQHTRPFPNSGAGQWGVGRGSPSQRGGPSERGGYQSTGQTTGSDSESGRGGRGGRGRGGFRGDRGGRGGRGRGGDRGGAGKADGTPASTPAPATGGGDS